MSGGLRPHKLVLDAGCAHHFDFVGIRFEVGGRIAGGSAREVLYFEAYRCRHCLEAANFKLEGASHDSYQPVRYGATPKP